MDIKKFVSSIILFILLFTSVTVYAHKPIFVGNDINSLNKAKVIEKPQISWAIYSELTNENEIDFYKIEELKGTEIFIQMTIPKIKGLEEFSPTVVILGKGLPLDKQNLPFDIPEGYGAKIIESTSVKREFFEPFTQTRYLIRQEDTIELKHSGKYYIAVYDTNNQTGKYTLAIGKEEDFEITDILKFPYTWLKVRLWYNSVQTMLILILSFVFILSIIKVVKKKKKV